MPILKSVPSKRIINGELVESSELTIVSEEFYETNGEDTIIVKSVKTGVIKLNSKNTDHVTIKALTNVLVMPDVGKIDEEFDEVDFDKGACVEFRYGLGNWYILSSDGIKQS